MIKKIKEKHLPQLIDIWNKHYDMLASSDKHTLDSIKRWYGKKEEGGFEYFGYFDEGELLGFVITKDEGNVIWLKFIAVENPKEGIGSKLVKYVIRGSEDKEIKTEVLVENGEILKFFKKHSFQVEKRTEDQFILQYLKD